MSPQVFLFSTCPSSPSAAGRRSKGKTSAGKIFYLQYSACFPHQVGKGRDSAAESTPVRRASSRSARMLLQDTRSMMGHQEEMLLSSMCFNQVSSKEGTVEDIQRLLTIRNDLHSVSSLIGLHETPRRRISQYHVALAAPSHYSHPGETEHEAWRGAPPPPVEQHPTYQSQHSQIGE